MEAWPKTPEPLAEWMASLGTPDCACPHKWESSGRLYGISMGNEWHRMLTVRTCPCHGEGTRFWREPRATAKGSPS